MLLFLAFNYVTGARNEPVSTLYGNTAFPPTVQPTKPELHLHINLTLEIALPIGGGTIVFAIATIIYKLRNNNHTAQGQLQEATTELTVNPNGPTVTVQI